MAQKKSVFVYDNQGTEIHNISKFITPKRLEYLPYHYLLVGANDSGYLKYIDVTTGKFASEHRWHFDTLNDMKQNPWNATVLTGDARGVVCI